MKRVPNFFIVGSPKAGTTALYNYLMQHPEIFMPEEEKEPEFFSTDIFSKEKNYRKEKNYLSLFKNVKNEKRIGEASVSYSYSKDAPKNIKDYCGKDTKIIFMLRNPVDLLSSMHNQHFFQGTEDISNFEKALELESFRKRGELLPELKLSPQKILYKEIVHKIFKNVKRYLDIFGKENVKFIFYLDFRNNPEKVYTETLKFLGVNKNFIPNFRVMNKRKKPKSLLLRKVYIKIKKLPEPIKNFIKFFIRPKLRRKILKLNTKEIEREEIPKELASKIMKEFSKDIRDLEKVFNKDVGVCLSLS